jgi:hypothetical protein
MACAGQLEVATQRAPGRTSNTLSNQASEIEAATVYPTPMGSGSQWLLSGREAGSRRSVDGPENGRGVAMGESELTQLAEPLSNIANRKCLRFAT